MNKQFIYLPFAVLVSVLAACTPPEKDIPGLTSEVDAATAGHYGQSIHHEQMAEEKLEESNKVLEHWKKGYYWNIDERQKAMDAAKEAAQHKLASEKELCQWIVDVHGKSHHHDELVHTEAAYFKTGSATPYKTNDHEISVLGKYLGTHPDATADVTAYTDTVGSAESNQQLSDRRAATVSEMLNEYGAKMEQLHVKAMGEAQGPDNTPDQHHRVVTISVAHPGFTDCSNLK
ncbi:MAG: OmpA family protein [Methylobacter sp.]|nr:OmpA family protein [Methylobacter sp.]